MTTYRKIQTNGLHTEEALNILKEEIKDENSLSTILEKAKQILERSVDPTQGPPSKPNDGLLYGLIQSGKTSIITVLIALAVDNGFQCVLILTSDIDLLYCQTLERIRKALRGINVLGKNDSKDQIRFQRQTRTTPFAIVCSKNSSKLSSLLNAFQSSSAKNISILIIDDEADQASLNTRASRGGNQLSRINNVISNLRNFFPINTYLQVTATPQALFLQSPDGRYRPTFTVLSEPGPGYIGGERFFGDGAHLVEHVSLDEVNYLVSPNQPSSSGNIPIGLRRALLTFFVGATSRLIKNSSNNFAFLCHVSLNQRDHQFIVELIDRYKERMINWFKNKSKPSFENFKIELQAAYTNLAKTEPNLPPFEDILTKLEFYINGANIKLINALTNEEVNLDAAYNIFVGGNKLGRGVTIKNLLVSYYGRNPRRPNADTVLQHARMYGYRNKDMGITRLFLPERLENHFRIIHDMEKGLRRLIERHPMGYFEGVYISSPLQPTRRNVLDPNSIGFYLGGSYCNPIYPLRNKDVVDNTKWLDEKLEQYDDSIPYYKTNIDEIISIIKKCEHDPDYGADLWNKKNLITALEKIKDLRGESAYIRVRRNRNLSTKRNETQGFLSGGEATVVPNDALTLFIYRLSKRNSEDFEVWWPLIRFPEGNYVLAFSFRT